MKYVIAVSYTHLDVYKRQSLDLAHFCLLQALGLVLNNQWPLFPKKKNNFCIKHKTRKRGYNGSRAWFYLGLNPWILWCDGACKLGKYLGQNEISEITEIDTQANVYHVIVLYVYVNVIVRLFFQLVSLITPCLLYTSRCV